MIKTKFETVEMIMDLHSYSLLTVQLTNNHQNDSQGASLFANFDGEEMLLKTECGPRGKMGLAPLI
jgi:hypothetical protein